MENVETFKKIIAYGFGTPIPRSYCANVLSFGNETWTDIFWELTIQGNLTIIVRELDMIEWQMSPFWKAE